MNQMEPSTERLQGRRILLIEDDFMIGDALAELLQAEGAEVVGPIGVAAEAIALLRVDRRFDGAVLDVDLHGERSYRVADALEALRIPFLFTTGYDEQAVDAAYRGHPRQEKPINGRLLLAALAAMIPGTAGSPPG